MRIPVYIRPSRDSGTVQAYCPDVPGCSGCGRTEAEAIATLRRRLAAQLAASARTAPPDVRVIDLDV